MANLNSIELKAFIPAKDFELSKNFYSDLGFTKASDEHGVAYFYKGNCSFLLQDFYNATLAENLMMHFLVEDVASWHKKITDLQIASKYGVLVSSPEEQPWKMIDFTVHDPSGVLWRIGQNI